MGWKNYEAGDENSFHAKHKKISGFCIQKLILSSTELYASCLEFSFYEQNRDKKFQILRRFGLSSSSVEIPESMMNLLLVSMDKV